MKLQYFHLSNGRRTARQSADRTSIIADLEAGQDVVFNEDEPDAVVNLLKILHMQYTWPKPMAPLELVALAIVTDK